MTLSSGCVYYAVSSISETFTSSWRQKQLLDSLQWRQGGPLNLSECFRVSRTSEGVYCHVSEWLSTGFGLVIEFIDHSQVVTASNHSATANSHMLQFTTARTVFSICCFFTSRCLVAAFNGGSSLYSGFLNYPRASATPASNSNSS
jgi:hypothetical protein